MITSVEEKGPYIVVAPGFAFAHARPSDAVHRTAMSWVRLARPVEFGHASNDPVSLVVALSAKDQKAHLQAMRSLATLLGSPETRAALDTAATPEEVLAVLTQEAPAAPARGTIAPFPRIGPLPHVFIPARHHRLAAARHIGIGQLRHGAGAHGIADIGEAQRVQPVQRPELAVRERPLCPQLA